VEWGAVAAGQKEKPGEGEAGRGHRAISEERSETDGKTTDETKLDRWTSGRNGVEGGTNGRGTDRNPTKYRNHKSATARKKNAIKMTKLRQTEVFIHLQIKM